MDDDGRQELVGGFARAGELGGALVPFAIDWDDRAGRYELVSLQPDRPSLASIRIRDAVAAAVRPAYLRRTTFRDRRPGRRRELAGYQVHDFAITPSPERLLAGRLIEPRNERDGPELEVAPYQFRKTEGAPRVVPCERDDPRRPLTAAVPVDRAPQNFMLDWWRELSERRQRCAAVLGPQRRPAPERR